MNSTSRPARTRRPPVALGLILALAACTGPAQPAASPTPSVTGTPTAEPAPTAGPTASGTPSSGPSPTPTTGPELPPGPALGPVTDVPQDVLTGLSVPWSLAFLPTGAVLVTHRDTARVTLLTATGDAQLTGPGADALVDTTVHGGEGGLLGVAVAPDVDRTGLVYLYRTAVAGNEVVRAVLDDGTLGELEPVLQGIPAAANHNGGRIAFGPDGQLYVGTGDAGEPGAAQDPGSLAGKILRVTPDGAPAPGNPTPGSPVWSLGHRNVQGLGWAPDGRMLATELGQNTYDELNVITPGANYGWPVVEGLGGAAPMVDPVLTWAPEIASPSGLAVAPDGVHLAALRGQRIWSVRFAPDGFADAGDWLVGDLGRLRDVVLGPDGALWVLTTNTDGRGQPRPGDDRLVRVAPG